MSDEEEPTEPDQTDSTEEPYDYSDTVPPELAWTQKRPPLWFSIGVDLISLLSRLVAAVLVFEQWGLWLILTSQIVPPWTMAIGVVIMVAQMLTIFESDKPETDECG